ncbi:hypothetical protein VNI00_007686 [Paramarasmius palmivorus]|uniref:Uncharacterized protein n=1 Tax=Paramarasmius palmivorus TaxID=297713 RepID=A0AAW0D204_9AGAR
MSTPTYQKRHIALQSAPGELNRHNEYLEGLLKQLKTSRENMERVSAVTRQENEVETKSISKAKRFWSRKNLKENAREQTEQQERKLAEALEVEFREQATLKSLEKVVEEAIRKKDKLVDKVTESNEVKEELRQLYDKIFDGPTPEFPENDELQNNLKLAQKATDNIQTRIFSHSQAENCLVEAEENLDLCLARLNVALMPGSYSSVASVRLKGQDYLESATVLGSEAQKLLKRARTICPEVPAFPPIRVKDHPALVENFLFSNIDSVETVHLEVYPELSKLRKTIRKEWKSAADRYNTTAEYDLNESAEVIAQCREDLFKHRSGIMELVLNAPPSYGRSRSTRYPNALPPTPGSPGPSMMVLAPPTLPPLPIQPSLSTPPALPTQSLSVPPPPPSPPVPLPQSLSDSPYTERSPSSSPNLPISHLHSPRGSMNLERSSVSSSPRHEPSPPFLALPGAEANGGLLGSPIGPPPSYTSAWD